MNFTTEIKAGGIPCLAKVAVYAAPYGGDRYCPPNGWEFDYILMDRRGRPAPWLAKVVDREGREGWEKIEGSIEAAIEAKVEESWNDYD